MGGRGGGLNAGSQPKGRDDEPKFEYDPAKSASNKEKHGIDFEEAKLLWNDNNRFSIPSKYRNEARELTVAQRYGKTYVAVTTMRSGRTRIISVRRAREFEVRMYEENRNDS
jgi:uncharacterized DUF497 family protein